MVTSLLVALMGHALAISQLVTPGENWEETPIAQKSPEYHPMLKFWGSAAFYFQTPYYTVEGHYQMTDGHYVFRPETVIQLGHRELVLLVAEMNERAREETQIEYARSMANFEADYRRSDGSLMLTYSVNGRGKTYELHSYTEGDDQLDNVLNSEERGVGGLWHAPDPFPEKLDARVRYKIGDIQGLQDFSKEAKASDESQFGLLDLRVDRSFRVHASVGTWTRNGSTVRLFKDGKETDFTLSPDGTKLLIGGKKAYVRG